MYIDKVNELRKIFMGEWFKPLTEEEWEEIKHQPQAHIVEIMIDGELVSLMLMHEMKRFTRNVLILDDAISDPEWRGFGLGKSLYNICVSLGKKLGVGCIESEVAQSNDITNHIYEKLGFKDRKHIAWRKWLK